MNGVEKVAVVVVVAAVRANALSDIDAYIPLKRSRIHTAHLQTWTINIVLTAKEGLIAVAGARTRTEVGKQATRPALLVAV